MVVFKFISQLINNRFHDDEFMYMLAWYYMVADYYFADYFHKETLDQYIGAVDLSKKLTPSLSLDKRGQMGMYWASIEWDLK